MPSWSLSSPWLVVGLALFAAALLGLSAPRRRSPVPRVASVVAALLAGLAYTNASFAYFPQLGDLVGPRPWPVLPAGSVQQLASATGPWHARPGMRQPRGAVTDLSISGRNSHTSRTQALVYLPPQYFSQPGRRFPVMYLIHGSPGVPLDWFRGAEAAQAGLAAARAGAPMILVAPRMSRGWLADSECVDSPRQAVESYLVRDVLPQVDALLRTDSRAGGRAIAGNSAGGYCALTLGLRHPELFSYVAALSALTRPSYAYGSLGDLFGHPPALRHVIEQHTPSWLLRHWPSSRHVQVLLDVGDSDPLRQEVTRFAHLEEALGQHPRLTIRHGGHTYRVWRPALKDALMWFGQQSSPTVASGTAASARTPLT